MTGVRKGLEKVVEGKRIEEQEGIMVRRVMGGREVEDSEVYVNKNLEKELEKLKE